MKHRETKWSKTEKGKIRQKKIKWEVITYRELELPKKEGGRQSNTGKDND